MSTVDVITPCIVAVTLVMVWLERDAVDHYARRPFDACYKCFERVIIRYCSGSAPGGRPPPEHVIEMRRAVWKSGVLRLFICMPVTIYFAQNNFRLLSGNEFVCEELPPTANWEGSSKETVNCQLPIDKRTNG